MYNIPFNSGFSVTAFFGQVNPVWWGSSFHKGIDLVCRDAKGNPGNIVCNMDSGKVTGVYGVANSTVWQFGNWVKIQEDNSMREHLYCHMATKSPLKFGQTVHRGDFIGIMGATGNVEGPHLHYQINVNGTAQNPSLYLQIPNVTGYYEPSQYPVTEGIVIDTPAFNNEDFTDTDIVDQQRAVDLSKALQATSGTYNGLLNLSEDERKYGVSVYDITQSLIKTTTFSGVQGKSGNNANSVTDALLKYSRFLYYLLNSSVKTATIQMIGSPWIRPGVNVWVDPMFIDKVYYVNRVRHVGDPNGVYTTLELSLGRNRIDFQNTALSSEDDFGSLTGKDHVFVNKITSPVSAFGQTISSAERFQTFKKYIEVFYNTDSNQNLKALNNPFYLKFYNEKDISGSDTGVAAVQKMLDAKYAAAPAIVKERKAILTEIVKRAEQYISTHYVY